MFTARPYRGVLAFMTGVIVLSSCGGQAGSPEGTAKAFIDSVLARDAEAACALTASERTGVPAKDSPEDFAECMAFIDLAIGTSSLVREAAGKEVTVSAASITGDSATVSDQDITIDGEALPDGDSSPMELTRIDGAWYVTDLG